MAKKKKDVTKKFTKMNEEIEPIYGSYWEFNRRTIQLGLRDIGRPKPRWQFTETIGAYY